MVGGTIKNTGIKNASCRELGDLVVGRDGGWYVCRRSTDPSPVGFGPALGKQPATPFSHDLRKASLRASDPL